MLRIIRAALIAAILVSPTATFAQTVTNNGTQSPAANPLSPSAYAPFPQVVGGTGTTKPYNRLTLATGVATWTFASSGLTFFNKPVCVATEEGTTGAYVKITAISALAVTFTSNVTASNSDPVDVLCFPAPI
jgi:hypothetical protein